MEKKLFTRFSSLLLVTAGLMLSTGAMADEGTEAEKTAADASITSGKVYRIYTYSTDGGATTGDTKYYLGLDGTMKTSTNDAGQFTLRQVENTEKDNYAATAWFVNYFTNCNKGATTSTGINRTPTNKPNFRTTWEAQVFFLKDGKYAIRSTNYYNANYSNYQPHAYWTSRTDGSNIYACYTHYTDNSAVAATYIWQLEEVTLSTPSIDVSKVYTIVSNRTGTDVSGYSYRYIMSPTYDGTTPTQVMRTKDIDKAARLQFIAKGNYYYLKDLVSGKYLKSPKFSNDGTIWSWADANDEAEIIIDGNALSSVEMRSPYANGLANASGGVDNSSKITVANYPKYNDNGRLWTIEESDLNTMTSNIATVSTNAVTDNLTLKYTGSVTTYGTLILPFAATLPDGVDAYKLTSVDGNAIKGVKQTSIPANTPVLLKGTATDQVFTGTAVAPSSETVTSGILTGVYSSTELATGNNYYVLQNQDAEGIKFYSVGSSAVTISPLHAYLTAPTSSLAAVLNFSLDDVVTGIDGTKTTANAAANEWYGMDGIRKVKPIQGLNLIKMSDGTVKKVFKK